MPRTTPRIPLQPFLGFQLVALTTTRFRELVVARARARATPFAIGYLNAAQVNLAFANAEHARRLAELHALYADGQAIVWASRWLKRPVPERINAGDFTRELIADCARAGLKLALIGGRPGAEGTPAEVDRAAARFRQWEPELRLVLTHHGYLSPDDARAVRTKIEAADPDLVMLGMGAPRQEALAARWAADGRPRVWWCVGALFEYYAGTRRRAPRWMRRAGLEWLVRLALEPRRLFRRYVIGNPLFVLRVLRRRPPAYRANR